MSDVTLPAKLRPTMRRAMRLEYWNIFWSATVIAAIGLTTGQSQTMKTAWVEDMVGLVPPIAFLVAARFELKGRRSRLFPFGFERGNGLGFFVAAVALFAVGGQLLYDAVTTLIAGERASVGSVTILGHTIWLGWLMLAAQAYAMIPPFIIGRRELPLAKELNDKLLHTDALMNKANWMTGAAGIAGVLGLGMGWWWADSVAAAVISASIIHDGVDALRAATAELIDGMPRALDCKTVAEDAEALQAALEARFPGATVRLRETGRVIRAEVHGERAPDTHVDPEHYWPGDPDRAWRLAQVSFAPGKSS
jgi:divalent metal cation (Fe/Co/Zn/Cd) transporter